jgi:hypothetical protein
MVRIPVPIKDHGRGGFLSEKILMKMESATDTRMTVEHKVLQRKRALKDNEGADDWNNYEPRLASQPSQRHTDFSFRTSCA